MRLSWVGFALFVVGATAFLIFGLLPLERLAPGAAYELTVRPGEKTFGFIPSLGTVGAYLLVVVCMSALYLTLRPRLRNAPAVQLNPRLVRCLWWATSAAGIGAVCVQVVHLHAIPLVNILARQHESPKLVFVAELLAAAAPMGVALWGWRWDTTLVVLAGVGGLAALGARNLPIALLLALVVALPLRLSWRQTRRLIGILAVIGFLVFGLVGIVSKHGIYGGNYNAVKAPMLLRTDSLGAFYNLQRVIEKSPPGGEFHGRLFTETAGNLLQISNGPYANYTLGAYLGSGKSYVRGVATGKQSLSTTMAGPAFADFGWWGLILSGAVVGALWALFEALAVANRWLVGLFAWWAARIMLGMDVGWLNEAVIGATLLCLVAVAMAGVLGWRQRTVRKQHLEERVAAEV